MGPTESLDSSTPQQPASPDLEGPGASPAQRERGGKSGLEHQGTAAAAAAQGAGLLGQPQEPSKNRKFQPRAPPRTGQVGEMLSLRAGQINNSPGAHHTVGTVLGKSGPFHSLKEERSEGPRTARLYLLGLKRQVLGHLWASAKWEFGQGDPISGFGPDIPRMSYWTLQWPLMTKGISFFGERKIQKILTCSVWVKYHSKTSRKNHR